MNNAQSTTITTTTPQHLHALHWILRIAFVMDFIGHGAYGFLQKPAWAAPICSKGQPRRR